MFPVVQKLVLGNHTRTARDGLDPPGNRHIWVTFLALAVLFSAAEIADTLHMESSTRLSAPDTGPITVDQVGLGEYLSLHAGICAGLAVAFLFGLTVVGLAVPLAAVALVFLTIRSVCLSALFF